VATQRVMIAWLRFSRTNWNTPGGYAPGDAIAIARKLLPDILSYDPRRPTSFPNNGRTLRDDVVDVFFSIYTNRKVAGDNVGPHGDLLDDFPYLGPPHKIRRAAPIR
jgi:hypothetical protein